MSEPKQRPVCMNPAHKDEPTTSVDGDWERCSVCGKERLSFKPADEDDTLDALMDRSTTTWPGPASGVEVAEPQKPYILWINYHTEGWQPTDCDTLADCYRTAINMCASDFLITGPRINVGFIDLNEQRN